MQRQTIKAQLHQHQDQWTENAAVCPPLHTRNIPYIARYAATPQPTNEVILLIFFTSVALVRNEVCSLRMVELPKHVGAD
jgi:hypothetical protein